MQSQRHATTESGSGLGLAGQSCGTEHRVIVESFGVTTKSDALSAQASARAPGQHADASGCGEGVADYHCLSALH